MTPPALSLSTGEREPLVVRAAITTALTALIHVAVIVGVLDLDAAAETSIGATIDAVGLVVLLLWARPAVTSNAKVIARVTTTGDVVAGDAAVETTGGGLDVHTYGSAGRTEPDALIVSAAVNPDLVAPGVAT